MEVAMTNPIVTIALITMLMLVGVLSATAVVGKDAPDKPIDSQIAKLHAERIETLQQVVRELETMHRDGHGDKLRIHAARSDLIEAQLELATTKAERLALLREHLELAKFGEEFAEAQYRAGLRSHVECLQAKATRLQREIAVVRETGD
jgi:outer membrane protein TolC